MIKNYTEPKNKAIWAQYQPLVRILFACGLLASFYSGITEFYKFYSGFDIPDDKTRFAAALAITLVIEFALRGFSKSLFEAIFEPAHADDKERETFEGEVIERERGRPVMIVLYALAVLAVGYVSTTNSLDGKRQYIDDTVALPDSFQHDNTEFQVLKAQADADFASDSLKVLAEVSQEIAAQRSEYEQIQEKADKDMNWLKSQGKGDWESLKPHYNKRENAKMAIAALPQQQQDKVAVALLAHKSDYNAALVNARAVLSASIGEAKQKNNESYQEYISRKKRTQNSYSYLVYLSIVLIVLYNFFKYYAYKASGRKPVYIVNPIGHSISPIAKLKEGLKAKMWNGINNVVHRWIGDEVEVNESRLEIKVKKKLMDEEELEAEEKVLDDDEMEEEVGGKSEQELEQEIDGEADLRKRYGKPEQKVEPRTEQTKVEQEEKLNKNAFKTERQAKKGKTEQKKTEQKDEQKTEQKLQQFDYPIEMILSSTFLQRVRNHYWASKGLHGRGGKKNTRERNKAKYEEEKRILQGVGVKVIEGENDVKFDITAVKKDD